MKTKKYKNITIHYATDAILKKAEKRSRYNREWLVSLYGTVKYLLRMFPADSDISITFLKNKEQVGEKWLEFYGVHYELKGFYYKQGNMIYISTGYFDLKPRVLAHEMGHAVIELYLDKPLPIAPQEVLCQWIETQI